MKRVRGIWAKTGTGGTWLPLEAHLDDCAAVMRQLWSTALLPRQRKWLAAGWGLTESQTADLAVALAGLHDLGKASESFQTLQADLAERLRGNRPAERLHRVTVRHDAITGEALRRWLMERECDVDVADALVATVAGHHGAIRGYRDLEQAADVLRGSRWRAVQNEILTERLDVGLIKEVAPTPNAAAVLTLAGWVSIADWLASDVGNFPVERDDDFDRKRAAASAASQHWRMSNPATVSFGELFCAPNGAPRTPRASQRAVIDLLATLEDRPQLILLEDRTGSGKTEAALWASKRALDQGAAGVYVGMPTRATAGQLHGRVSRFAERLWPETNPLVRLMHAPPAPDLGSSAREDDGEIAEAGTWFDGSRQGLLAPFGVGTIDQALLGALCSKHFFVRLTGLQGKVVVVDEVHAYDAYTGEILERLLTWLAALDCPVILLSATLSARQRASLCDAYERGRPRPEQPPAPTPTPNPFARAARPEIRQPEAEPRPYPRLTMTAGATGRRTVAIDDDRPGRRVAIEQLGLSADVEEADRELAAAVCAELEDERGGCVAVVCNTVASAQRRWRALRSFLPAGTELVLLHARHRPIERLPIEAQVLQQLGPPDTTRTRPRRMLVISTQIIEQSLDLDFDVMFSDLAPVDLMIQRAGRIHRHDGRERSSKHAVPRLVVLDRAGAELARPFLTATDAVYELGPLVRTRFSLQSRGEIEEPGDLDDLIEAVYGEPIPGNAPDDEAAAMAAADGETAERCTRLRRRAEDGLIPDILADPIWRSGMDARRDADALGPGGNFTAETRYSDLPSINAVVLAAGELASTSTAPRTRDEARALLDRSVSISSSRVVRPLIDAMKAHPAARFQPLAWSHNTLLRHHHLIEIEADGPATLRDPRCGLCLTVPIALDPEQGVRIV